MKFNFGYVILLTALAVASCAGYFSVWGLSQLFAGASTSVIIVMSILEVSKVVATTTLHKYWGQLNKVLRNYLTGGVILLMLITSAGIYGYLSNAYQSTANKLEIHEGELSVLDGKRMIFEKNITDNEKIITVKNKRIELLTNLRTNQENRLDSAKTTKTKDKVRNDIALATSEIQKLSNDIDGVNVKNAVLSDSVSKYNGKALTLKAGSSVAAEVGPLKYISKLTGQPMDKVVNYLILLIIFVFDPLAIALILATNRVFQLQAEEKIKVIDIIPSPAFPMPTPEAIHEDVESVIDDSTEDDTSEELPDGPWNLRTEADAEAERIIDEVPEVTPEPIAPEVIVDKPTKKPVVTTGKIEVEDIKEIKEGNRGYSVPVPTPKNTNNSIQRIGTNKIVKNGDNDTVFFKRK